MFSTGCNVTNAGVAMCRLSAVRFDCFGLDDTE